ncbi:hypothetical protein GNI_217000, partial [Gregarina niphandrodes]
PFRVSVVAHRIPSPTRLCFRTLLWPPILLRRPILRKLRIPGEQRRRLRMNGRNEAGEAISATRIRAELHLRRPRQDGSSEVSPGDRTTVCHQALLLSARPQMSKYSREGDFRAGDSGTSDPLLYILDRSVTTLECLCQVELPHQTLCDRHSSHPRRRNRPLVQVRARVLKELSVSLRRRSRRLSTRTRQKPPTQYRIHNPYRTSRHRDHRVPQQRTSPPTTRTHLRVIPVVVRVVVQDVDLGVALGVDTFLLSCAFLLSSVVSNVLFSDVVSNIFLPPVLLPVLSPFLLREVFWSSVSRKSM